jgi:hypothetical protein
LVFSNFKQNQQKNSDYRGFSFFNTFYYALFEPLLVFFAASALTFFVFWCNMQAIREVPYYYITKLLMALAPRKEQ